MTIAVGASSGNAGDPWNSALVSVAADLHVVRRRLHAQAGASAQAAPFDTDAVIEGHLLAGISAAAGPAVFTVAAGPSLAYVSRSRYGTPESPVTGFAGRTEGYVPGVYGSLGASVVLVPEVGLGVEAFGHLNARMPVAGLRLTAALGRLPRSAIRSPLPARFVPASLVDAGLPRVGSSITLAGYGVLREGEARSTGTYRSAALVAVEPYGPGRILIWAADPAGAGRKPGTGACQGDSGGPMVLADGGVVAVASWSTGPSGKSCGLLSQGVLVGPQRAWIDKTLSNWGESATWTTSR